MSDPKPNRPMRRGLSALMADVGVEPGDMGARPARPDTNLPIEALHANPDQPRRTFDENDLSDLAASIGQRGIIQPIIVRPSNATAGEYEIVAGERRWRAAQRAGLHEVPAVIREMDDLEVLEVAIIENIQRSDLNAIEEAMGFRQLMERFGHTQEKLSNVLGKSRSHVANLMRLLKLPESVQTQVQSGILSPGHARALIGSEDPVRLAGIVVSKGLSVRETERLAKSDDDGKRKNSSTAKPTKDVDTLALEADLSAALGLKVQISHSADLGGGAVSIRYKSLEDLDLLCARLSEGLAR